MVKLVAFDLDGTVLDPAGQPLPSALDALYALTERGMSIASVSGRSIRRSLQSFAGHAELAAGMYVCGYNGAAGVGPVQHGHRRLLYTRRLTEEILLALVDYAEEQDLNLVYCRCEAGAEGLVEEYRFRQPTNGALAAIDWEGAGYVWDPRLLERLRGGEFSTPPKVMLFADPQRQERILAELQERFGGRIYVAWAVKELLEIMPAGTDKGVALQALAQETGTPLAEIMAIGDGNNDLPMLTRAGLGLLMGSAAPEVRQAIADTAIRLAPPFVEDGFARAVEQYALG